MSTDNGDSVRDWSSLRTLVPLAMICCAVLAAANSRSNLDPNQDIDVRVGDSFEIASSHGRTWYPTIHQSPGGEIMVTFGMNEDAVGARLFSAYCISSDGGL